MEQAIQEQAAQDQSVQEHRPEHCESVREILARVGDKWTGVVLRVLLGKRMRFKDLHRAISGISQRMLVVTLRNLERDGFVARTVYPTVPPRVEYELTERGRSLGTVLEPLGAWVVGHHDAIAESRRRFDENAQSGAQTRVTPTLIKW